MAYSQSGNEFSVQDYPNIFAADTPAELQERTEALVREELSSSVNLDLFLRGALVIKHRELLRKIFAPKYVVALKGLLDRFHDKMSDVVTVEETSLTRSDEFWDLMRHVTNEIPTLQYNDLRALRDEGKWGFQPRALFVAIACNSIAAAVQGWDQTGTNGANLFWPNDFGIPIADCGSKDILKESECGKNSLLVGLVNAAPYIIITLFASWISDPLNHSLGRRGTIFAGAILSLVAPLGSALTQSWPQLLICRLILGVGMGLKEVTVPVFSAEIAPPEIRGALVMSWQIWTAAGILLGSCANLVAMEMSQNRNLIWRYQIGSAFIPALLLLFGVMNSPESPRWLVRQNRVEEAYESLIRLRGRNNKMLATRDLHYLCVKITSRKGKEGADTDRAYQRFTGLFEKGPNRFAMLASSIVMITQQLCGINILAFYSSTIFAHIQGNQAKSLKQVRKALLFTFGFGAINFTFGWLAFWQIDRRGRRFLLLSTLPFMFLSLFIAGLCYRTLELHTRMELVSLFVFFFTVFYSPGPGPVAFAYSAEVFRIEYREIGMGWAVAMNNLFASGLSIIFPRLFFTFGGIGAFEFFAGLNILALILVFFYVPETHQLTLEQLDAIFDQDIGAHVAYGNKVLQWFWSTYLLGKHEESCPQFYNGEPRSYVEPESRVLR